MEGLCTSIRDTQVQRPTANGWLRWGKSRMPTNNHFTRPDEESHYFELLNALSEVGLKFEMLDVPADARDLLLDLTARCRADFNTRFR